VSEFLAATDDICIRNLRLGVFVRQFKVIRDYLRVIYRMFTSPIPICPWVMLSGADIT
jgi:hypothetical protein